MPTVEFDATDFNNVVCLAISFHGFGLTKKADTGKVEVDADESMIKVSKRLFDSEEFDAIATLDRQVTKFLHQRGYQPSILKGGIYVFKIGIIPKVLERLDEFRIKRQELVEKLGLAYDKLKEDAEGRLRVMFNPNDYPSASVVQSKYWMDWKIFNYFEPPKKLQEISAEIFKAEQERAQAQWYSALDEMESIVRAEFAELVGHMNEILQPNEDGKPKRFHQTFIDGVNDFLNNFEAKNFNNSSELADLVSQARNSLQGLNAKQIKSNDQLRAQMQKEFQELSDKAKAMTVKQPIRKIGFGLSASATAAPDAKAA